MKNKLLQLMGLILLIISGTLNMNGQPNGQNELKQTENWPVHFPNVGGNPGEDSWAIFIRNATIGGVTVIPGDEIAVFDGERCVGSLVFNVIPSEETQYENELVAYQVISSGIGYIPGHPVSYKLWRSSENMESDLCPSNYYNEYGDAWAENFFPADGYQYSMIGVNCSPGDCLVPPYAYAGVNNFICEGAVYQLSEALSANCDQLLWSTTGTGSFDNPQIIHPVYTPSDEDNLTGMITLTLTASKEGYNSVSNSMVLSIGLYPEQAGEITGETEVCQGSSNIYNIPVIPNADSYEWVLSPASAGQLTNNGSICSIDFNSLYSGTAILNAFGSNYCGYGMASPPFEITVMNCSNISENGHNIRVELKPNPASDKVSITISDDLKTASSLKLFDIYSKPVLNISMENSKNNSEIDVSNLSPGLYFLIFRNASSTTCHKLLISR